MKVKKVQIPTWMKNKGYLKLLGGINGQMSGSGKVITVMKNGVVRISNKSK